MLGVWLLAVAPAPGAESHIPPNLSSHDAGFLTELLAGRVVVMKRPSRSRKWDVNNVATFFYRDASGAEVGCNPYGEWGGHWVVIEDERYRALFMSWAPGEDPDVKLWRDGGFPMFYDPESGSLRTEGWRATEGEWVVKSEGWVQESWPAAGQSWCPDLDLPVELAVNGRQTARHLDDMRAQDPDAPIRRFKGMAASSAGKAGAVAAFSPLALKAFLIAQNGTVLKVAPSAEGWPAGSRYVLVLNRERDELWALEAGGDAIADIAYITAPSAADEFVIAYERSGATHTYRFGDPFPLLATGERYAAMRLMDWLVGLGRDVRLPFGETDGEDGAQNRSVGFTFEPAGVVKARRKDGAQAPGRWWWSRGELRIHVEGIKTINTYPWAALGRHVGWGSG